MMTPQQRRLIEQLQRLHAAGEPLNITAVKRRHPDLLKAVMAVTPYWGWKRALEDAGIAYTRIKVELLDGIECALCGKWWRQLPNHLKWTHEMQSDEYLMDYPDSDLVCEEIRAREMKKEAKVVPHWEPLWSREYTLDRLAEYHRRGIPIHSSGLKENDNTLMMAATHHAGGWREALTAIDLDPEQITRQGYLQLRRYPDKQSVIEEIRRRQQEGFSLLSRTISKKKERSHTYPSLVRRGIEYFGSWPKALRAAGFDPVTVREQVFRKRRHYPDEPSVIEALQRRQRDGLPVTHADVAKGTFKDYALQKAIPVLFDRWNNALKAAGINPAEAREQLLRKNRRYPDKPAVIEAIQRRNETGCRLIMPTY
ncbi:MAG: hypothetical protein HY343_11750 [Lentisphaerae bacterium]|nr:hypothetical protein [Lentisphaerota bacterium]